MITARLADTPYQFIQRLPPHEIVLRYGDGASAIDERWRVATLPNITHSSYRIIVRGTAYRFAGQLPKNRAAVSLGRRGGKVTSPAKTAAARANGAKGGRPKKSTK